jgi:hypothetical protein
MVQISPESAKQAEQMMSALLSRSATDPTFRQQLLTQPRAAVSEYLGREVPESFDVTFIENRADATIVLPAAIDPEAELSEQELEAVAGGSTLACVASVLWIAAELIEATK